MISSIDNRIKRKELVFRYVLDTITLLLNPMMLLNLQLNVTRINVLRNKVTYLEEKLERFSNSEKVDMLLIYNV